MTTRHRTPGRPKGLALASGLGGLGVFFAVWGGLAVGSQPSSSTVLSDASLPTAGQVPSNSRSVHTQPAMRRSPVTRVARTHTRSS